MISPDEALIVVLSRRDRSKAEQKRVEERVAACKCLMKKKIAGAFVDCSNDSTASRGLCIACENAFDEFLKSLPPEKAAKKEEDAIAKGWILRQQEIRAIKSQYAFSKLG